MNQKNVLFALLGLAVGAMVIPAANAGTCLMKSSSGACLMYTGSVRCEDLNASGLGNVNKDPKYWSCKVEKPLDNTVLPGIVYCGNKGGNIGVGAQAWIANGFSGLATITPSQVDKNGFASGGLVSATANAAQLAALDYVCWSQNSNWNAIDFVPTAMSVAVQVLDENGVLTYTGSQLNETTFDCVLPNPETMTWDKKAGTPERRAYNCTERQ